ncbi:MAG: hypothetical protein E7388_02435 [Ruminococcaceae bacterium]|nr:hypothetical protein [Oscillospiraceae bacterium]
MAISDIFIIIIFLVTVITCTVKGLALTLYSVFSTAISIIGAFLLRPFVSAGLIYIGADKFFYKTFYEAINAVRLECFGNSTIGTGAKLATELNIPDFAKGLLEHNVRSWTTSGSLDTIVDEMSTSLAQFVVNAISVILLIIIIMIGMHFLKKVLSFFSKIPVIRQINKLGGFVMGVILAFFWISVLGMVAHLFSTAEYFTYILADIENSLIAHYFYNTNFIALIISHL